MLQIFEISQPTTNNLVGIRLGKTLIERYLIINYNNNWWAHTLNANTTLNEIMLGVSRFCVG